MIENAKHRWDADIEFLLKQSRGEVIRGEERWRSWQESMNTIYYLPNRRHDEYMRIIITSQLGLKLSVGNINYFIQKQDKK